MALVVHQFYCMALYHSQTGHHLIKSTTEFCAFLLQYFKLHVLILLSSGVVVEGLKAGKVMFLRL